jgi:hypothetical protein
MKANICEQTYSRVALKYVSFIHDVFLFKYKHWVIQTERQQYDKMVGGAYLDGNSFHL